MAVTIESSSIATFATGTSTVVTKPTGLSVGDLMVAHYVYRNSTASHTLPSGFTSIQSLQTNIGWSVVAYKTADLSDVSASNFTFTTSSSYNQNAALLRISGFPSASPISQNNGQGNVLTGTNPSFTTTITPYANSLLLMFIGAASGATTYTTPSAYAVVTDNPTWTELYDSSNGTSGAFAGMACAYATRTQTTATGNSSITGSYAGGSNYGWSCVVLGIAPSKDITVSESTTLSETFLENQEIRVSETSTLTEDIDVEKLRQWNTENKNTSTWINQDKS